MFDVKEIDIEACRGETPDAESQEVSEGGAVNDNESCFVFAQESCSLFSVTKVRSLTKNPHILLYSCSPKNAFSNFFAPQT